MKLVGTKLELRRLTSRAPVKLYCERCSKIFQIPKNQLLAKIEKAKRRERGRTGKLYCSHQCATAAQIRYKIKPCKNCGEQTKVMFCSQSCSAKYNNSRRSPKRFCLKCGKQIKQAKFCSGDCHHVYVAEKYIERWKDGKESGMTPAGAICRFVRSYIFRKYGKKCVKCGWCEVNPKSGTVPVQIEHIDGDYRNCSEENLTVLCPNCHSLTPTYMGLNRGNGRDIGGARRKKKRLARIVQLTEHSLGTGETGV